MRSRTLLVRMSGVSWALLDLVLSLCLTAALAPPLILIFLLNELGRCIVSLLLFRQRIRLLPDGADAIWAYERPGNTRNILILYVYNSPLCISHFRKNYTERVLGHVEESSGRRPYAKLEEVLVKRFGYYCWAKDTHFHVQNHIREYPVSSDEPVTESQLLAYLSTLTEDMDSSRPQWEEIIVPRFRYDATNPEDKVERSARIWRAHHAYMDGGSNLLMTGTCMRSDGDKEPFPYLVDPLAPTRRPIWKEVLINGYCLLFGLATLLRNLYQAAQIQSRFLMRRYSGKHRFAWSQPIPIPVLKGIRHQTQASLPQILASVALGALKHLDSSVTAAEDKRTMSLGLVGAMLPYPNITPSNRFTVMNFFSDGVSESSRVGRLLRIKADMEALLRRPDAMVNYTVFRLMGRFPAFVVRLLMDGASMAVVYSNVPWASRKVRLWGDEVNEVAGFMPLATSAGLGLLTVSYCDKMRFCLIADETCLSEAETQRVLAQISTEVGLLSSECQAMAQATSATSVLAADGPHKILPV